MVTRLGRAAGALAQVWVAAPPPGSAYVMVMVTWPASPAVTATPLSGTSARCEVIVTGPATVPPVLASRAIVSVPVRS